MYRQCKLRLNILTFEKLSYVGYFCVGFIGVEHRLFLNGSNL